MTLARDLDELCRALAGQLPPGTHVAGVKPLLTGFSNETFLIEGCDLIARFPPSAGAMLDGHDVIAQAQIYRALADVTGAPPVPGIVMIWEDRSAVGDPFFVMERVPGEAVSDVDLQAWFVEASVDFRHELSRQWISVFASLARLRPPAVLGNPVTPDADARRWRSFAAKAECPRLVECFDALLTIPAPRSGPPAIVHGDPKLSNVMWHDGRISAVLDWEMALNGEPLSDLGYILYGMESEHHGAARPHKLSGMLTRAEVIELWSQASGRSPEGLVWHEIAQLAKIGSIIAEGANMFATGRSQDPKLSLFKQNLEYYLGVIEAMLNDPRLLALKG